MHLVHDKLRKFVKIKQHYPKDVLKYHHQIASKHHHQRSQLKPAYAKHDKTNLPIKQVISKLIKTMTHHLAFCKNIIKILTTK